MAVVFFRPKELKTSIFLELSAPPLNALDALGKTVKKFFLSPAIYDQYVLTRRERDIYKSKWIALNEDVGKSKRLDDINALRKQRSYASVVADVIGRDPTNWNASLIINKGDIHGIKVGMPVINPQGIVGKIIEVGRSTAKVILLSDANFSVAAVVTRTRESGLLTGTLEDLCRLKYLSDKADVKVGDEIVTSGLSTSFPEGILIGRVVDVQAATSHFTVECLVEPAVDLSQIEEVIVVKK